MNNLQTKNVLLLGGPGDGKMMCVDARARGVRLPEADLSDLPFMPLSADSPLKVQYHTYGITVLHGSNHEIYCVGQQDMTDCPIERLVAGYRKPKPHPTDANVALQLLTLVGGDGDGAQIAVSDNQTTRTWRGTEYRIIPLEGKDGKTFRVGMPVTFKGSPISTLIQGYRK